VKVNFLLPDFTKHPSGGLKVQYEFANRLSGLGHDVVVYHSLNFDRRVFTHPRSFAGLVKRNLMGPRAVEWFPVRGSVGCRFLPSIMPRLLRTADVTIFNSFLIAGRLPPGNRRAGQLFEIVYEYPVWKYGDQDLRSQLVSSLRRDDVSHIAGSSVVEQMLAEIGVRPVATITCGIDLPSPDAVITPTGKRDPIVAFPLRPEAHKGAGDILAATTLIRARHPEARFECFGWHPRPSDVPEGLVYHGYLDDETLTELYRRCMVFVLPSHAEGWGLPAAEAMANGAAVVVSENGGSSDFAFDRETALVVPPHGPEGLADAVCELLASPQLRAQLVDAGTRRCQTMSWDRSLQELLQVLAGPGSSTLQPSPARQSSFGTGAS
jgi:glycosyltransferase involved in cell wall biosynthesis